jgi:hypothetical protein
MFPLGLFLNASQIELGQLVNDSHIHRTTNLDTILSSYWAGNQRSKAQSWAKGATRIDKIFVIETHNLQDRIDGLASASSAISGHHHQHQHQHQQHGMNGLSTVSRIKSHISSVAPKSLNSKRNPSTQSCSLFRLAEVLLQTSLTRLSNHLRGHQPRRMPLNRAGTIIVTLNSASSQIHMVKISTRPKISMERLR